MKINMVIKNKRIEQNLTQEQLANHLGISAAAVNVLSRHHITFTTS